MPVEAHIKQVNPSTALITFTGALTLGTTLKMTDSQIQSLLAQNVSRLVLDMTGVPYVDSAGLGLLVHTYGLTQEKGGKMRLCGVSDRVISLLKMTHTQEFLPIDPNAEASLSALD